MAACFDVVVAADLDRGIARGGVMPWHLPGEMAHFKRLTTHTREPGRQNAVIMGRRTWAALPARFRPLPGRRNVVLSRQPALALPDGVVHAACMEEALAWAAREPAVEEVFVIGGGAVYAEALSLPACRRIYYTRIAARFGCDTRFPRFEDRYTLESVLAEAEEGGIAYRVEVWRKPGSS
jgi:dihydrofolate reductase